MATRNVTPRATGEGSVGESGLRWLSTYVGSLFATQLGEDLSCNGKSITGLILAAQNAASSVTSGKFISLDSTPDADWFSSADVGVYTAALTMSFGSLACATTTANTLTLADADVNNPGMYMCVSTSISQGATGLFMRSGHAHLHTAAPGWTVGGVLAMSLTAGSIMALSATVTTGDFLQAVGIAEDTDIIDFRPSPVVVEI